MSRGARSHTRWAPLGGLVAFAARSRLRWALLGGLAALFVSGSAAAHGTSKSFGEWVISGASAELRLNFDAHDLVAGLAGLDADGDRTLSAEELAAGAERVGRHVVEGTTLAAAGGERRTTSAAEGGDARRAGVERAPLAAESGALDARRAGSERPPASGGAGGEALLTPCRPGAPLVRGVGVPPEEVQVRLGFTCPAPIARLRLEARYLPGLEPPHLSIATLIAGSETAQHVFTPDTPVLDLEVTPPSLGAELGEALRSGARAGLRVTAVLFALALAALGGGAGGALRLVAFGAAHGVAASVGAAPASSLASLTGGALAWVGVECFAGRSGRLGALRRVALALLGGAILGISAASALPPFASLARVAALGAVTLAPVAIFLASRFGVAFLGRWSAEVPRAAGAGALAAAAAVWALAAS